MRKICFILLVLLLGYANIGVDKTIKDTPTGKNKMTDFPANSLMFYNPADGYAYTNSTTGGPVDTQAPYATSTTQSVPTYADPYAQYGGSAAYNQNISQYDQGIGNTQSAIDRLPSQFNSGAQGIDVSYQNALNQLLGNENQGRATYDTNTLQNKQDYVAGKNTVRSNAGSSLNGLLRLLGSRGAGGSSAATITAPGAVARQATLQQSDLGNTYGHNAQSLDTNWNNFETGINNQRSSASNQRDQQRQGLQQSIDQNRANLLQTLASLSGQKAAYTGGNATAAAQPYLDQANNTLNSLANYSVAPINYQTQAYNAPDLAKYLSSAITPTFNGQTQSNDYTSPYLQALLGKKQQATPVGA